MTSLTPPRQPRKVRPGEMAERPIAPVLKTGVPARVPRVRIPVSPLYQLHSDSRNPCLTSYVDRGCGCRCFQARPVHLWVAGPQPSSPIRNGCQENRQPLVQPNFAHLTRLVESFDRCRWSKEAVSSAKGAPRRSLVVVRLTWLLCQTACGVRDADRHSTELGQTASPQPSELVRSCG